MPSDRAASIEVIAGFERSSQGPRLRAAIDAGARPSAGRFTGIFSGRAARFSPGMHDDRGPPPLRVTIDGKRPPRVQPAAVASAIHFADFAIVLIAGIGSFALQSAIGWPPPFLPTVTAVLVLALMTRGLGATQHRDLTRQSLSRLLGGGIVHLLAAFGFALVTAVAVLQPEATVRAALVAWLLAWAAIAMIGVIAARGVLSFLQTRWHRAGRLKQLVAVYGTGDLAECLVERLRGCPEIDIVGVFDDRAGRGTIGKGLRALPHGTTAELVAMSRLMQIDRIVVALPHSAEKRLLEILRMLHRMPVEISLAPDMVGFHVPARGHEAFGGLPLLDVYGKPLNAGQVLVKSVFARLAAGLGPRDNRFSDPPRRLASD